ncbi:hypothetical protein PENSPDRAFT_678587 [Peniophora sp. CONT]|nr:hypothetical protein PENSPDRAFT_678587 [Peniophora sp. CONT]
MPAFRFVAPFLVAAFAAISSVRAESHTITFTNNCGYGTPTLSQNFNVLSTGAPYTANGPFEAAIAYLDTGNCGFDGSDCLIVETTLKNGAVSSTDLSLISPHTFSATTGFGYYSGCDGSGAQCSGSDCSTAFHSSTDYQVQVQCQSDNVNLAITFC